MARLLLLALALAACATVAEAPLPDVFRTGLDPRYPGDRYLVGVGAGPSLEEARRRAVASIAAQLEASVHASDGLSASLRTGAAATEELWQEIRVESRFDRPAWIRLVDSRVHEGRVHVVALLDRLQAAALLEAEQEVRRIALRDLLDRQAVETDLRRRAEILAEADRITRALLPAAATLAALRGQPGPLPGEIRRVAEARAELARLRRETLVRVCVEPALPTGVGPDLAGRFEAVLAGAGVRTAPCEGPQEGWVLTGRLVADTSGARQQPGAFLRFCTARLDYRLADAGGSVLRGGTEGGHESRAGGHDYHAACLASASAVARAVATAIGLVDPPGRR